MSELRFWKTETIGNDFVLVMDEDVMGLDLTDLAIAACARRTGIGADGLLVIAQAAFGATLRMFNPDGTEDFCGNGLRCAASFANDQAWCGEEFEILHGGRQIPAWIRPGGRATVRLPAADFRPSAVPVDSGSEFIDQEVQGVVGTAVSTGSTHFVVLVESLPDDREFFRISPRIETDPVFPDHSSVMYVRDAGSGRLEMRIWERGAGETLGCGTGSAAAAAVVARRSGQGGRFVVANPGGDLEVFLRDWQSPIESTSRPLVTFTGSVPSLTPVTAGKLAGNVRLV